MVGRKIGNYELVRPLGEGGMGVVYLAQHPKIGKRVAVKMLHENLCKDPDLVSRFFEEARAVNRVGHPHIVDISDFGQTDEGIFYFVMELLSGITLREEMQKKAPLRLRRAVAIARQIADAAGAAHRVGIVHRDLKPENVFLTNGPSGDVPDTVKLFDFGIAKLVGDSFDPMHKTTPGFVMGTLCYMSPEQVEGRTIDARTDIYALGVVLYEMLTGTVPYRATQLVEFVAAQQKGPPPPPSFHAPGLPVGIDRAVLRCLDKQPAARFQTMAELVAAIDEGERRANYQSHAELPRDDRPIELAIEPRRRARPRLIHRAANATTSFRTAFGRLPTAYRKLALVAGVLMLVLMIRPALTPLVGKARDLIWPKPPALPAELAVTLDSIPTGATVVRVDDGRVIGTTPTRDFHRIEGQTVEYVLRLDGFIEAHVPLEVIAPGDRTIRVTLRSPESPASVAAKITKQRPVAKRRDRAGVAPPSLADRRAAEPVEQRR